MAKEQRLVRFSGNVQGVGFRYTACRLAEGFDITGYAQNLPDGRVECLIEAEKREIDAFIQALTDRMAGYIRQTTQQTAPADGSYRSFDVKFSGGGF